MHARLAAMQRDLESELWNLPQILSLNGGALLSKRYQKKIEHDGDGVQGTSTLALVTKIG